MYCPIEHRQYLTTILILKHSTKHIDDVWRNILTIFSKGIRTIKRFSYMDIKLLGLNSVPTTVTGVD